MYLFFQTQEKQILSTGISRTNQFWNLSAIQTEGLPSVSQAFTMSSAKSNTNTTQKLKTTQSLGKVTPYTDILLEQESRSY